ncbi:MAG: beta-galactosidase [Clostridia bacterium]|nr:beta-galactosidase [Clostridia bacterium]
MFVFGTQYLRGFTPERDQWERDMENMKKIGFNTIRAWLVWNAVERREGEIDYDYIEQFLTCAKQYELQVGLLFHLHACPAWAIEKFSKYFYVSEDNLPFEPAVRPNTPSGGWPGLCFDNEEVREMEHRFISGVIAETKKHDNVAFYEPMNEPHQWVDYMKNPAGIFCYCPASVRKFRIWLQKKYGDIEALNNAWGYFYDSFDEVRPPRWTSSYSDYIDFRQFTVDNIVEEIRYRSDIIRSCDNKPVIAHAWGGGAVTCSQLGGMAFDDWKNAEIFDKWGYSAFPRSADDCCMLGFGCNAARSAAGGKEYWQSELTAGITGSIFEQSGRIDDNTYDKFSLESIRHGAVGLLYWQYRKERIGAEIGGFSLTDYDGGPTNLTRKAEALGRMLREHGDMLTEGSMKPAEVGLVFSIRSYFADWAIAKKGGNKAAVDSLSGYYRMFWEENIPIDIIHEEYAENLSRYKLIILPNAAAISPRLADKLKEYISNGGVLLSEQLFGIFEESFKLSYHVPGFGYDEIFGVREHDLHPRKTVTLTDGEKDYHFKGNRYAEKFCDVTGEGLYFYEDGTPAIVSKAYGSGKAMITGINLGLCYSSRELLGDDFKSSDTGNTSGASKAIVMKLCRSLGVDENRCSVPDVKVSVLTTDKECMLILINSASADREGLIRLEEAYVETKTVYGRCDATVCGSTLRFTLKANESAVLRLVQG